MQKYINLQKILFKKKKTKILQDIIIIIITLL
jgi:hypothetical protein